MQQHKYFDRTQRELVQFGGFVLDMHTGELTSGDQIVALRPMATRCLVLLVKRAGRLVTLEQIRRELWGTTVVDWNAGIHQAIRQIRRALEDHDHAIIESVTRHGYRFRLQVESVIPMGNDRNEVFSPPRRRLRIYAAGFSTPIVLGSIFFLVCGFAF